MKNLKGRTIIIGFIGTLMFSVVAILLIRDRSEPTHNGRKLSECLNEMMALRWDKRSKSDTPQAVAVRAFGTNALPWLLDELRNPGNRWVIRFNALLQKQTMITNRFLVPDERLRRASHGFAALGEIAAPAIPELLTLVESRPGYVPGILARIGPEAIPALQFCLTNTNYASPQVSMWIRGNTIGGIHNAWNHELLSTSDVTNFLPDICAFAPINVTNGSFNYASNFLYAYGVKWEAQREAHERPVFCR